MKKIYCIGLCLALVKIAAFAQDIDFSAGGGALFAMGFAQPGGDRGLKLREMDPGAYVFFDATFHEVSLNVFKGFHKATFDAAGGTGTSTRTFDITYMSLEVCGKYPIALGSVTIFPLLGFEFMFCLSAPGLPEEFDSKVWYFNAMWLKLGVGADFALTKKLYLRGELLYGVKSGNKFDENVRDYFGTSFFFTHRPAVKTGAGYKF